MINISVENSTFFEYFDEDFERYLAQALDEGENTLDNFITPIFLLGLKTDSKQSQNNENDFMDLAKRNDWGFGFCTNKEERDEEIKTFATIVRQIGIYPQLSASRNPGEIIFSDSESDNYASIDDNPVFRKANTINVGSKKPNSNFESNGSLIFGDSKHEIKLQKKTSRTDKYLSFHDEGN